MSIGATSVANSHIVTDVRVAIRTLLMLPLLLTVALGFAVDNAEAHGGGPGLGYDPCMRQAGTDDFVHLAVYQPEFNPFAEYCDALPKAGRTMLVFDLMGAELPEARVSLEVLQEGGRFQLSVPAQRYHTGVADLPADLPAGTYTVLISIEQPDGHHRLAFPLAVGAWWDRLMVPIAIVLLIGFATAGYCILQIRGVASESASALMNHPVKLQRRQN
jgi:hypothetical protein